MLTFRSSSKHFYRLESESEISSSDESVFSAQMQMTGLEIIHYTSPFMICSTTTKCLSFTFAHTASCQDTPDTSSTEESDVEFTVLTSNDSVSAQPEVSSGPEVSLLVFVFLLYFESHNCV